MSDLEKEFEPTAIQACSLTDLPEKYGLAVIQIQYLEQQLTIARATIDACMRLHDKQDKQLKVARECIQFYAELEQSGHSYHSGGGNGFYITSSLATEALKQLEE